VPDADATKLARSAAMVARGMIAGEAAECDVRRLMDDWAQVVHVAQVSDAAA
jgi:hypothetical protein